MSNEIAILKCPVPKSCEDCILYHSSWMHNEPGICAATDEYVHDGFQDSRFEKCPLTILPENYSVAHIPFKSEGLLSVTSGHHTISAKKPNGIEISYSGKICVFECSPEEAKRHDEWASTVIG